MINANFAKGQLRARRQSSSAAALLRCNAQAARLRLYTSTRKRKRQSGQRQYLGQQQALSANQASPESSGGLYELEEEGDTDDGECEVFIDRDGEFVEVLCCDYGFRSGYGRLYQQEYGQIPKNFFAMGLENFKREYQYLRSSFRYDDYNTISTANPPTGFLGKLGASAAKVVVDAFAAIDVKLEESSLFTKLKPRQAPRVVTASGQNRKDCEEVLAKLQQLKLSNEAIWERERRREAAGRGVKSAWPIRVAYYALCLMLDVLYANRPIQRFWLLETVARMPYFSYISMLHLYESLGWWRAGAELRKVHFAEEWNELHHLQIMESLGGDLLWVDRFIGQHAAIVYYWVLILFYVFTPQHAYNFSELIEAHAVDTYGEFVDANEELLKSMPPPLVALNYYRSGDLYLFDEFQTGQYRAQELRRPTCANLYDVFRNIRDDEGEHVKTMAACANQSIGLDLQERSQQVGVVATMSETMGN